MSYGLGLYGLKKMKGKIKKEKREMDFMLGPSSRAWAGPRGEKEKK